MTLRKTPVRQYVIPADLIVFPEFRSGFPEKGRAASMIPDVMIKHHNANQETKDGEVIFQTLSGKRA